MHIRLRASLLLAFGIALPVHSAVAPYRGATRGSEENFSADVMLHMGSLLPAPEAGGRSTFGGRCSRASDYVISFTFEGNSLPLGNISGWAEHCSLVITRITVGSQILPDSTRYEDGRLLMVTLAGDTLRGAYGNGVSGMRPDGLAWFRDEFALFGGTGRFELASGRGTDIGVFAPDRPSPMRIEGTIRYRTAVAAD